MTTEVLWWITAFELPCFAGLFWLIWNIKRETAHFNGHLLELVQTRTNDLREALNNHKLEVARHYVTILELKELENRLASHLLRIEAKLETTALKTEALGATTQERKDLYRKD